MNHVLSHSEYYREHEKALKAVEKHLGIPRSHYDTLPHYILWDDYAKISKFSLIDRIAQLKVYLARSLTYVSWIQTPLLFLTLLNTLVLLGLDINIRLWGPIIGVAGVFIMLAIGFFDEKYRVMHKEQAYAWSRNDSYSDLKDSLARIEKKLGENK